MDQDLAATGHEVGVTVTAWHHVGDHSDDCPDIAIAGGHTPASLRRASSIGAAALKTRLHRLADL
jgi:hypothetical protein